MSSRFAVGIVRAVSLALALFLVCPASPQGCLFWVTITTPSPLPSGTVGVAYSQTFAAIVAGNDPVPLQWSMSGSLPAGLTLSSAGVLSGIPTAPGTFTFAVTAVNGCGNYDRGQFAFTIIPGPLATPAVSPSLLLPMAGMIILIGYRQLRQRQA